MRQSATLLRFGGFRHPFPLRMIGLALKTLFGDPSIAFPLDFVRVEPYVIPKVSLTRADAERVDVFSEAPESPQP